MTHLNKSLKNKTFASGKPGYVPIMKSLHLSLMLGYFWIPIASFQML